MADINPEPAPSSSNNANGVSNHGNKDNTTQVEVTMAEQERIRSNLEEFERLFGVDEEAYDQPTTTRKELWSYYLYYNGIMSTDVIICAIANPFAKVTMELALGHIVKPCKLIISLMIFYQSPANLISVASNGP